MALGHRTPLFLRESSPGIPAVTISLTIVGFSILLCLFGGMFLQPFEDGTEEDGHQLFAESLLHMRDGWIENEDDWKRYLTGYFSVADVEEDILSSYETGFREEFLSATSRAEYALVLDTIGEREKALAQWEIAKNEEWEENWWINSLRSAIEQKPFAEDDIAEVVDYLEGYPSDWWCIRVLELAGVEPPEASLQTRWYDKAVSSGGYSYGIVLACLACFPLVLILFRRVTWPAESRLLLALKPDRVLVLAVWGLVLPFVTGILFYFLPAGALNGSSATILEVVDYLIFQGTPVILLSAFLIPACCSGFFRTFGLTKEQIFSGKLLFVALGSLGLVYVVDTLLYEIEGLFSALDTRDFMDVYYMDGQIFTLVGQLIIASLIAPFFEEVFFRGFLYGAMKSRKGKFKAAFWSSVLFALLHFYSPFGLISVFLFGLVMCWIYQKTRSLWPGILAHALLNAQITFNLWWYFSPE